MKGTGDFVLALTSPVVGVIGDKFKRVRIMALAGVCWGLLALGSTFIRSYILFFVLWEVAVAVATPLRVFPFALLADYFPDELSI